MDKSVPLLDSGKDSRRVIVALDGMSPKEAKRTMKEIYHGLSKKHQKHIAFKLNDQLGLVGLLGARKLLGKKPGFIDGKYFDIPNTTGNYMTKVKDSKIKNPTHLTIHASGGEDMIKKSVAKRNEEDLDTVILGVTVLTSMTEGQTREVYNENDKFQVLNLADIALRDGADGVVSSPVEGKMLREVFGDKYPNFLLVTPNIRDDSQQVVKNDDQNKRRRATPTEAIERGATDIVVGRLITQAKDKVKATKRIIKEILAAEYQGPEGKYEFEKILYTGSREELLRYIGAIYKRQEGQKYVRLASGLISDGYLNNARSEKNFRVLNRASKELASLMRERNIEGDLVVGAQQGSVRLSSHMGQATGIQESIYFEKGGDDGKDMILKRHDIDLQDRKAIISEDVLTKGTTTKKLIHAIREGKGDVSCVTCIINRFGSDEIEGVPIISCHVPDAGFNFWYDESTPTNARKNYSSLPSDGLVEESPKNNRESLLNQTEKTESITDIDTK